MAPITLEAGNSLALASWCARRGTDTQDRVDVYSAGLRSRVATSLTRAIKRHARWTPRGPVGRYTMRATDGLRTTITLGPVNGDGRAFALELSLGMSLPVPEQDEQLPDRIEAF